MLIIPIAILAVALIALSYQHHMERAGREMDIQLSARQPHKVVNFNAEGARYKSHNYGEQKVGPKGDKGDKGDRGHTGTPGIRGQHGEKGDRGEQGMRGAPYVPQVESVSADAQTVSFNTSGPGTTEAVENPYKNQPYFKSGNKAHHEDEPWAEEMPDLASKKHHNHRDKVETMFASIQIPVGKHRKHHKED